MKNCSKHCHLSYVIQTEMEMCQSRGIINDDEEREKKTWLKRDLIVSRSACCVSCRSNFIYDSHATVNRYTRTHRNLMPSYKCMIINKQKQTCHWEDERIEQGKMSVKRGEKWHNLLRIGNLLFHFSRSIALGADPTWGEKRKRNNCTPIKRAAVKYIKKTFTHRTLISVNSIFHYAFLRGCCFTLFFLACLMSIDNILYALLIALNAYSHTGHEKRGEKMHRYANNCFTFFSFPFACMCINWIARTLGSTTRLLGVFISFSSSSGWFSMRFLAARFFSTEIPLRNGKTKDYFFGFKKLNNHLTKVRKLFDKNSNHVDWSAGIFKFESIFLGSDWKWMENVSCPKSENEFFF